MRADEGRHLVLLDPRPVPIAQELLHVLPGVFCAARVVPYVLPLCLHDGASRGGQNVRQSGEQGSFRGASSSSGWAMLAALAMAVSAAPLCCALRRYSPWTR